MYQTIAESISVLGVFEKSAFVPRKFKWKNRTFSIETITSIHELSDGGIAKRRYAVISQGNLYLIEYNRQQETWELLQIWLEG